MVSTNSTTCRACGRPILPGIDVRRISHARIGDHARLVRECCATTRAFDDNDLALVYQEETADGETSNFNKPIGCETPKERASGHPNASRRHAVSRQRSSATRSSNRSKSSKSSSRSSRGRSR